MITIMKALYLSSLNGHATGRARRLVSNRLVRASSATNHWSSTENNQNNAWNVNFNNGNTNNNNKYNSNVVRAVAALTDEDILSIVDAYNDCCRHKMTSMQCTLFRLVHEYQLLPLMASIKTHTYYPSTSTVFIVTKPKLREVFAANFRDRVAQHWVTLRIEPMIEEGFLRSGDASYNCRKGYGTLRAVNRLQSDMRDLVQLPVADLYVMKLDIRSFFMSIDLTILLKSVLSMINGRYNASDKDALLWLIGIIIRHRPETDCAYRGDKRLIDLLPKHKSLFGSDKNVGLPIGNITSQLLANYYMVPFDMLADRYCNMFRCRYKRFVDDFYMVGDKDRLIRFRAIADEFLRSELHLTLHKDKVYLQPISHGITFVGSIVSTRRVRLIRRTMATLHRSVMQLERLSLFRARGKISDDEHYFASINSLLGFTRHTNDFARKLRLFRRMRYLHRYYRLSDGLCVMHRIDNQ